MKGVPKEEQEKIIALALHNPALIQKIAEEIQHAVKSGQDQMVAMKSIAEKYKPELEDAMKKLQK